MKIQDVFGPVYLTHWNKDTGRAVFRVLRPPYKKMREIIDATRPTTFDMGSGVSGWLEEIDSSFGRASISQMSITVQIGILHVGMGQGLLDLWHAPDLTEFNSYMESMMPKTLVTATTQEEIQLCRDAMDPIRSDETSSQACVRTTRAQDELTKRGINAEKARFLAYGVVRVEKPAAIKCVCGGASIGSTHSDYCGLYVSTRRK